MTRRKSPVLAPGALERYRAAVAFLESLKGPPIRSRAGEARGAVFAPLRAFLDMLGNPHEGLRIIHIAGTSGKGTTVKLIEKLLVATGEGAGSYTSPFATTTAEKFSVNDRLVPPREFCEIVESRVKPALAAHAARHPAYPRPSYLWACLALALCFFEKRGVRFAALETGLGGTYDPTNVFERPAATAITSVGLDHTAILGATKAAIAREKAGIIKTGVPFVTAVRTPRLVDLFKKMCAERGAPFVPLRALLPAGDLGPHFSTAETRDDLTLALNVLAALDISVSKDAVRSIARNFSFIARQEIVARDPLVVVDGAHNEDKLRATAAFVNSLEFGALHLVFGIARGKRFRRALPALVQRARRVYLAPLPGNFKEGAPPEALAPAVRSHFSGPVGAYADARAALDAALAAAGPRDCVLITGSFFLAGALRARWVPEERMLADAPEP
jgi:folylpolyglutamate synthase/dihydrofolate synthase